MRVLHVYSGNLYGGIEAILTTIARNAGACHELDSEFGLCFEGRLRDQLVVARASVHTLGAVRVSRPHSVRRARRALTEVLASGRFDRVLCHATWAHALFAPVARRAGVPLVFWAHDVMRGGHWTERWAKRTPPDLVIANSRLTAASVSAVFPGVPVSVVYAPVESPSRNRSAEASLAEREAIRAELDTPPTATVIVHASRMEAWKGHEVLLDALSRLRDRREWVCWIVGGAQRPEEAALLESLRERARALGIADRVRFAEERTDVPRVLAAADIHCQPNIEPEPFGIAFIEALAAGLPIVTSGIGGALEIVDSSCGVLVPAGDGSALAAAVRVLLEDDARRARLAAAAPARARALCDPGQQLRMLCGALANIEAAVPVRR